MSAPQRIVFISSLERSGSTVLDLTLGRVPGFVSFGEVARVLQPHGPAGLKGVLGLPCSCGALANACPFWGQVLEFMQRAPVDLGLRERYTIFLSRVRDIYGDSAIAVDSSKYLVALDALQDAARRQHAQLNVLFLVRDVRGWISSARRAGRRRREIPHGTLLSPEIRERWRAYLRHNVLRLFPFWLPLEWYVRNRRIEKHVSNLPVAAMRISYERLALDTEATLKTTWAFLGAGDARLSTVPRSHVVRGNRMAFASARAPVIRYDAQWKTERWSQLEARLWRFVMSKNREWVYGPDGEASP